MGMLVDQLWEFHKGNMTKRDILIQEMAAAMKRIGKVDGKLVDEIAKKVTKSGKPIVDDKDYDAAIARVRQIP